MRGISVRQDIPVSVLRDRAKQEKSSSMCRRLLGIAHLIESGSRSEAQTIACLTLNVFRVWIRRFNAEGIEGLRSKKHTGRPPRISKAVGQRLKERILKGPSKEEGLVRYRIVDVQKILQEEHGISLGPSRIWYVLQDLGLTWKTGRQRHPKTKEHAQTTFKKTLKTR